MAKIRKQFCFQFLKFILLQGWRLQSDIASHVGLDNVEASHLTDQQAVELIHERLKYKSSLIVLDDARSVEAVSSLIERLGIPCGTVVVTTRNIEVHNIMDAFQIYHMEQSKIPGWQWPTRNC